MITAAGLTEQANISGAALNAPHDVRWERSGQRMRLSDRGSKNSGKR